MSIYDFSVTKADGSEFALSENAGKVMLVVNTATKCGFTPQYKELEDMYEKYHDKGLEIIDIPCNQFGEQAPESDAEIAQFCSLKYDTKFEQMKKSEVNGENALPLYAYLKAEAPFKGFGKGAKAKFLEKAVKKMSKSAVEESDIKWNFTKFVVDREGNVVARFEPTMDMGDLDKLVASLVG